MRSSTPLVDVLRGSLAPNAPDAPDAADETSEALEALLGATIADARRAWPSFALEAATFVAYLAARLPRGASIREGLASLRTGDLYLACGCASGVPGAIAAFRDAIVGDLDHAIVPAAGDRLDEVRQRVLDKLLVSTADAPPRIAAYRGHGALHAWVRVSAARVALDLERGRRDEVSLGDATLEAGDADKNADPEIAHLKATYRDELRCSIDRAASALSVRERNVLRQSVLDGLTIDELAALYGVHRATAARWLVSAREALARATKNDLRDRLGLGRGDLDSLFRLVESQFELGWSVLDP